MTPDWSEKPQPVPYANLSNPQTLNLYGYVGNNPLNSRDPDGHCCQDEWKFFKGEMRGFWNTTGGGVVALGQSFASGQAFSNMAETAKLAVTSPGAIVEAGKEFGSQMSGTVSKALDGDPEAFGEIVGTAAMIAAPSATGLLPSRATATMGVADVSGATTKAGKLIQEIRQSGAEVKLNPKSATQEGNVTIDFKNGQSVNLRVETHPLQRNGPPIRHANVEIVTQKGLKKTVENEHIVD